MKDKVFDTGMLLGTAGLLTCACAAASGLSKLGAACGVHAGTETLHATFHGAGVALILAGLWRRSHRAAWLGVAATLLLAAGLLGVPTSAMMGGTKAYEAAQVPSLMAYLAAAVLLVLAFHRAFPSRHPAASAAAMSGVVVASGCTCCMVMGAMSGLSATFLPSLPWLASRPFYALAGAALIAAGLARMGGLLPFAVGLAGQAVAYWGPDLARSLPQMTIRDVDMNFAFRYVVWFVGMAVTLWAVARALRVEDPKRTPKPVAAEPALAGSR